jgi:hypothetical protein
MILALISSIFSNMISLISLIWYDYSWFNCWCFICSYIIRHMKEFYSSPVANELDIAMSGYVVSTRLSNDTCKLTGFKTPMNLPNWSNPSNWPSNPKKIQQLQQIISHCLDFLYSDTDTPSGLQRTCDYMQVIKSFDAQARAWWMEWGEKRNWQCKCDFFALDLSWENDFGLPLLYLLWFRLRLNWSHDCLPFTSFRFSFYLFTSL